MLGKVRMLKDISLGIGKEVRESTSLMESMNEKFAQTANLLGGTFSRMKIMADKQGSQFCFWISFLFAVTIFFVLVWLWRR